MTVETRGEVAVDANLVADSKMSGAVLTIATLSIVDPKLAK